MFELHELKEEFCQRQLDFQLDRTFTNRKFFGWVRLYLRTRKIACLGDSYPNVKNRPFEVSNDKHFLEMLP
ncbi:hypothetical protein BH24BAC1_BH24BAC1_36250 [soil metagenome]